jgi:hypothetical protein
MIAIRRFKKIAPVLAIIIAFLLFVKSIQDGHTIKSNKNQIIKKNAIIDSITVNNENLTAENVRITQAYSSEKTKNITIKKESKRVDSINAVLVSKLQKSSKENIAFSSALDSITKDRNDWRNKYGKAIDDFEEINNKNKELSILIDSAELTINRQQDTLRDFNNIKSRFRIRISALLADKWDPSCQSVFKSVSEFMPNISEDVTLKIYSKAGEFLRKVAQRHKISPELYYMLCKSYPNVNPFQFCYEQSRSAFKQLIETGDFEYWSVHVFNANPTDVSRSIAVIKSLYNNFQ